jgi:hypothetical protein
MTLSEEAVRVTRDVAVYRAFLLQQRAQVVLDEIPSDSPHSALQAVRYLARAQLGETAAVEAELQEVLSTPAGSNPVMVLVAAQLAERGGRIEEAMRLAHGGRSSLECRALLVTLYCRLSRWTEAEKEVRSMLKEEEGEEGA